MCQSSSMSHPSLRRLFRERRSLSPPAICCHTWVASETMRRLKKINRRVPSKKRKLDQRCELCMWTRWIRVLSYDRKEFVKRCDCTELRLFDEKVVCKIMICCFWYLPVLWIFIIYRTFWNTCYWVLHLLIEHLKGSMFVIILNVKVTEAISLLVHSIACRKQHFYHWNIREFPEKARENQATERKYGRLWVPLGVLHKGVWFSWPKSKSEAMWSFFSVYYSILTH